MQSLRICSTLIFIPRGLSLVTLLVFASRSPNKKNVLFLCGLSPLGKLFYWFSQLEKEALMFVSVALLQPCVLLTCLFPKELCFTWGSIYISYVDMYFIQMEQFFVCLIWSLMSPQLVQVILPSISQVLGLRSYATIPGQNLYFFNS